VIALTYHDVTDDPAGSGFQGIGPDRYKLTPQRFDAQVAAVRSLNVHLTFDDGGASAIDAARILERHGLSGSFFVVTSVIGTPGFLDADAIRELRALGHQVGSHSHTHAFLTALTDDEVAHEWQESKAILEEIIGEHVVSASVPRGAYSSRIGRLAPFARLYTSEPWLRPRGHVYGRFAVTATTPDAEVVALARRSSRVLARRWAGWYVRRAAKAALGARYEALRRRALASSSE
jgi:peptidoglycan/xylan/chitin deacetylase (PgdA/CDA1 family)